MVKIASVVLYLHTSISETILASNVKRGKDLIFIHTLVAMPKRIPTLTLMMQTIVVVIFLMMILFQIVQDKLLISMGYLASIVTYLDSLIQHHQNALFAHLDKDSVLKVANALNQFIYNPITNLT